MYGTVSSFSYKNYTLFIYLFIYIFFSFFFFFFFILFVFFYGKMVTRSLM